MNTAIKPAKKSAVKPKAVKKKSVSQTVAAAVTAAIAAVTPAPAAPVEVVVPATNFITNHNFKLEAIEKEGGLAEIYQSMTLKISLCKLQEDGVTFKQVTKGVQCRDFLVDVYSSAIEKHNFAIYGMNWKGETESPDQDAIRLKLVFPNDKAKADFDKNLTRLFSIEDANKIERTQVYSIEGNVAIVVGSKAWLQNALSFSLYTFLIRAFCYELNTEDWIAELGDKNYKVAGSRPSDGKYIASIKRSAWDRILADLTSIHTEEFCGLSFKNDGTGAVHHNSGFISVFGSHSEINPATVKKNKHYKAMQERNFELFNHDTDNFYNC